MTPALVLTMADYYRTLAAARCVGERGVPVWMCAPSRLAPAMWSRFVTRRLRAPADPHALAAFLVELGEREPGHVLYPTSDDVLLAMAEREDDLRRVFRMCSPPRATILGLLDKAEVQRVWTELGGRAPRTWLPEEPRDVARVAREARFPVLIKPRLQALLRGQVKGSMVEEEGELVPAWRAFAARFPSDLFPRPMIQEYHPEALAAIDSLSGFLDRSGEVWVVRASRKLLQRPRRAGVGICFEEAEVDQALASRLRAFFTRIGYFGVFEVELIRHGAEEPLLIDVNPRFYGQMAFDVARGAPLPMLAYLAARGEDEAVRALAREASARTSSRAVHRAALALMIGLQRLSGVMTRREAERWTSFAREGTDLVIDRRDLAPAVADAIGQVRALVRHPRAAVRVMMFDRA